MHPGDTDLVNGTGRAPAGADAPDFLARWIPEVAGKDPEALLSLAAGRPCRFGELVSGLQDRLAPAIQRALDEAVRTGEKIGEALVRLGLLTARQRDVVLDFQRHQRGELPSQERLRLGNILVSQGLVSRAHLEQALVRQRESGRPVGEELVAAGLLDAEHLAQALAAQRRLVFGALAAALSLFALPARATDFVDPVTSSQTLDVASSPLGDLGGCGLVTGTHAYGARTLLANASGPHTFTVSSVTGLQGDTFLALYRGAFDPANPQANLVGCNDDANGLLSEFTATLAQGSTYTIVSTTYVGSLAGSIAYRVLPDVTLAGGPVPSGVRVDAIGAAGATLHATSPVAAEAWWVVALRGAGLPDAAGIRAGSAPGAVRAGHGTLSAGMPGAFPMPGLAAATDYTAYLVVEDGSQASSGIVAVDFTTAVALPVAGAAKAAQSIRFATLAPRRLGTAPFPLSAEGGPSGTPVVFSSLTPATCAIQSGASAAILAAGTCTIAADQAGNAAYLDAPRTTQTFRIVRDARPQPLAIEPRVDVRLSVPVESAPFVVSGLAEPVVLDVAAGEHSVGCTGIYTSLPGLVGEGQSVCVRHVSAPTAFTVKSSRVSIGSLVTTFQSTTGRPEAILALSAAASPTRYRADAQFTVEATGGYGPVTGSVSFSFGAEAILGCEAVPIVDSIARCHSNSLPPGARNVAASYAGDEMYTWSQGTLGHYVRAELRGDFRDADGGGNTSLLLHTPGGGLRVEIVKDAAIAAGGDLLPEGSGWHLAGSADFTGDGKADLLVRNDEGAHEIWRLAGTQVVSKTPLFAGPEGLSVVLVGDFDGDGRDDLVVRDAAGRLSLMSLDAKGAASRRPFETGAIGGTLAAADLDGDGHDDLVIARADGRVRVQLVKDGLPGAFADLDPPGAGYAVSAIGDFNGDNKADLLLRGPGGEIHAWQMDGLRIDRSAQLSGPTAYRVAHVADFDLDGADDLLLTSPGGEVQVWTMDGAKVDAAEVITDPATPPAWQQGVGTDGKAVATLPADWTLRQVGDFNGDGRPDLAFVHEPSGDIALLLLDNQKVSTWRRLASPAPWRLAP